MLPLNTPAPDFNLPDQNGELFHLADFIGRKNIVIFFYPKDNTRGCTVEACTFRDHYKEFLALDSELIGISGDSPGSHQKFASRFHLPFSLLSDRKNHVRKRYDAKGPLFGLIPGRITYIIDKHGLISFSLNSFSGFQSHIYACLEHLRSQESFSH